MTKPIDWKKVLSPEEYQILREKGTEAPFTGQYNDFYEDGIYLCRACGAKLFSSEDKYNSGTGWPSFKKPFVAENVVYEPDYSLGYERTETLCAVCEGHLGHYFDQESRYCMNSLSLEFLSKEEEDILETLSLPYSKEEIALIRSVLEQEGIEYSIQNEGLQDLFGAGRMGTGVNQIVGEIKMTLNKKNKKIAQYLIKEILQ